MTKIIFWNAEHLSNNAYDIYEHAKLKVRAANRSAQSQFARRADQGSTRAVTRGLVHGAGAGVAKRAHQKEVQLEIDAFVAEDAAQRQAERLKQKFELAEQLPASAKHVFLCEVMQGMPGAHNPLLGHANASTLHYAYYQDGAVTPFTHCPVSLGAGWHVPAAGAPAFPAGFRAPKSVNINGAGAGAGVRFCFWHAPSGNNGTVVAQMYASLAAPGVPFVLFGDLNAEPNDVVLAGVPAGDIVDPGCATRISGRTLDYAISNVPGRFSRLRPLHADLHGYDIKQRTGSDHMPMIMHFS